MRVNETSITRGGKVEARLLIITLTPAEARLIVLDSDTKPKVGYWFDTVENDTEYNIRIDVDWSEDGTVQHHGD